MNDSSSQCACRQLPRLEGAATQAYITQFLNKTDTDEQATYYQCRVCQRQWKKVGESKRPSLVQLEE